MGPVVGLVVEVLVVLDCCVAANGARIIWTAAHSVATSSRRDSRVRQDFGDYLEGLERQLP